MPEEGIQSWMSLVIYVAINTGANVFFSGEFYEELLPAGGHAKPSRVPSGCQDSKVRFWTALHHSSQITPLPVLSPASVPYCLSFVPLEILTLASCPDRASCNACPQVGAWVRLGSLSASWSHPSLPPCGSVSGLHANSLLYSTITGTLRQTCTILRGGAWAVGLKVLPLSVTLSPDFLWEKNFSVECDLWQIDSITILYVPE